MVTGRKRTPKKQSKRPAISSKPITSARRKKRCSNAGAMSLSRPSRLLRITTGGLGKSPPAGAEVVARFHEDAENVSRTRA